MLMGTDCAVAGWILALDRVMAQDGIDLARIAASLDVDPMLIGTGYGAYSHEQLYRLWRRVLDLTGDDALGLRVAREIRPPAFHVVGYIMSSSSTLRRALYRYTQYYRLIMPNSIASITKSRDCTTLAFQLEDGMPHIDTFTDIVVGGTLAFIRWISGCEIHPREIHFRRPRPSNEAVFDEFFHCRIVYGAAQDALVFLNQDLEHPLLAADEELASALEALANQYLEKTTVDQISIRVRTLLTENLSRGGVCRAAIAKELHLTERTLLRRLKAEGTTFVDLLSDVRQELAMKHLRQPGAKVSGMGHLLGFSDDGAFSRAFKTWTGQPPGSFCAINQSARHHSPIPTRLART
jgi:AraC-like DNA-binding protein